MADLFGRPNDFGCLSGLEIFAFGGFLEDGVEGLVDGTELLGRAESCGEKDPLMMSSVTACVPSTTDGPEGTAER
jgi:hypothetical protein